MITSNDSIYTYIYIYINNLLTVRVLFNYERLRNLFQE